jgi:hypothetical protein
MPEALALAADAGILEPRSGGWAHEPPVAEIDVRLTLRKTPGPSRILVLTANDDASLEVTLEGGAPLVASRREGALRVFELTEPLSTKQGRAAIHARSDAGVRALWIVPRAADIPPPPPTPWTASRRP